MKDPRDIERAKRKKEEFYAKHKDYTGFRMFAQPLKKESLSEEELLEREEIKAMNIGTKDIISMIIAAFSILLPYVLLIGLIFGIFVLLTEKLL
ncbi:MAG: hypothetical protein GXZ11_07700 [Tissierellia bacterium]|nr:hypothetical protein [Tissierellia bacterium]